MPDFLSTIGTFLSSPAGKGIGTLAGLGATGAGLYGNISADQQRAAAAKQAQANANLTPAQLGAQVNAATQPLNASLVRAVTGQVDANQAEQGLSESPGLTAQAVSQGLAPYAQQNQQQALQAVMARLGLPAQFAATIPPNANISQLLALLMRQNNPSQGATLPTQPNPGADTTGSYDFGSPTWDAGGGQQYPTTGTYDFGGGG